RWYRKENAPEDAISATFVFAKATDNKIMLEQNPGYLSRLRALPPVDRARLLEGDWDVIPAAGKVFNRQWAHLIAHSEVPSRPHLSDASFAIIGGKLVKVSSPDPTAIYQTIRFWDFAGTEAELNPTARADQEPDWTVGVKML